MRRVSGQVARGTGRLLHRLAAVAMAVAVLVAVLSMALVWRLSQGPLEVTWLIARIEAMANIEGSPTRLTVGSAALTWEGFQHGLERPLDLRLTNVAVTDDAGRRRMEIPRADLSISIRGLLLGRVLPRSVEVDGARLTLMRASDGTVSMDLGSLPETLDTDGPAASSGGDAAAPMADFLRELAQPSGFRAGAHQILGLLQRVAVRDATVTVVDRRLGTTWYAPRATITLARRPSGGVDGDATLALALGDQTATLTVKALMPAGDGATRVTAELSAVTPAALAHAAPTLAPLSALDAPVRISAETDIGADLMPTGGRLRVQVGPGQVTVAAEPVPLVGGVFAIAATATEATIETAELTVQGSETSKPTRLRLAGALRHEDAKLSIAGTLTLDQVAFADLPRLWPTHASAVTRAWIVENIPSGIARDGRVEMALRMSSDFSDLAVTHLQGMLDGEDLTVHWLRPVPPLEKGQAQLRFLDPDRIEITMSSARQKAGARAGWLNAGNGRMLITGMTVKDQFATIEADVSGTVPNAIGLLREPRLHLLDRQPIDFRDPSGDAAMRVSLRLPLERTINAEDVATRVTGKVTRLHLAGFVAGRDIDQADIDIDATDAGMTIKGRTLLAGIPLQVDAAMEFKDGPPTQIVHRATVTGRPSARQLSAAGLDGGDLLGGDVAGSATWTERRNGQAEITVEADLTPAELTAQPLGWRKPVGVPAKGSARVVLNRNQMRLVDRIVVDGEGLSLRGTAECQDGHVSVVKLDRANLGRTSMQGSFSVMKGQPIGMVMSGPVLDMSVKLSAKTTAEERRKAEAGTTPWTLDARFDRVLLADGQVATGVVARGQHDGRIFRAMNVSGNTGANAPFSLDIGASAGQRRLRITSRDAGTLLRGLDVVKTMETGTLTVTGTFDDARRGNPLSGSVEIADFRVRQSAGLGKILQAMTLYGLVDVLRGPGIGFSQLVGPFTLTNDVLTLDNARAFSPSLGLTAKGRLDMKAESADIEGTIVPAYFFNSLLGNIPLVGKLFSPETGGGVFAARYTMRGPIEDPTVFVNPLSALTPGFLREIFGLF